MSEFVIEHQPMRSAQAELHSRTYKKIEGKSGIWYIAIQENSADNVYYTSKSKRYSDGFGGATMTFRLEDGSEDKVQGPWHSNVGSLYADTGYDIRDKCLTFGVVGKNSRYDRETRKTIIEDVLFRDEGFVIGPFERVDIIAQELADKLGTSVYYYRQSSGGSSYGPKHPSGVKNK